MTRLYLALALLFTASFAPICYAGDETEGKFGDTMFVGYEGEQIWPTSANAQVLKDYSVPIYIGLPIRQYQVLGRIIDPRTNVVGEITRAFSEGLFSEKERQRDVANQAKFRGGDAVLVTGDARVLTALHLDKADLAKTTPLFEYKDKVTVVIKFAE
jgi:hypothetical protein